MAKPRYTSDPPPQSMEEAIEWAYRQFKRIDDYWPRSNDDRIDALELAALFKSGTWPIFGIGGFSIATRTEAAFTCNPTTIIDDSSYGDAQFPLSMQYSPYTGDVYVAVDRISIDVVSSINGIDVSADTVFSITSGEPRGGMLAISSSGSITDKRYLFFTLRNISGRTFPTLYDLDTGTFPEQYDSGASNAYTPLAEHETRVLSMSQNGNLGSYLKGTGITSVSMPSGYSHNSSTGAVRSSSTTFTIALKNTTTNDWHFWTQSGTSTPSSILANADTSITEFIGSAVVYGSNAYWPINYDDTGTGKAAILATDLSGNQVWLRTLTTGASSFSNGGRDRISLDATGEHIYYTIGNTMSRMNVATGVIEECAIDTFGGNAEYAQVVVVGDYAYLHDNTYIGQQLFAKMQIFG